jgi:HK97 family phage portal protein
VERYLHRNDPSQPLVIPADLLTVSQVRPLSLTDLAIKDGIELDKRDVAAIVGVPGYVVGVGEFSKGEHNAFIRTKFMYYVTVIQQELTKKLLLSPDEYFRLNARSLYAYDLQELAGIAQNLFIRGLMTGNEVRNWMGLSPKEGLDELTILENYIPLSAIGDQEKLQSSEGGKHEE